MRPLLRSMVPGLTMLALLIVGPRSGNAGPVSAVNFTGGVTEATGALVSAGFSFRTNQSVTIDALAVFSPLASGTNVRLYTVAGTVLATATVLPTDPTDGTFDFHSITPVTLSSSTTYYIAADLIVGQLSKFSETGLTTNPAITFGGEVEGGGLGGKPISDAQNGANNPGYFGPSFEIQSSMVPEPPGFVLLGIGAIAVLGCSRLRRRHLSTQGGKTRDMELMRYLSICHPWLAKPNLAVERRGTHMVRAIPVLAALAVLWGNVERARGGFVILDPPGAVTSLATGVSGSNVVGEYSSGGLVQGFLYDGLHYSTLDPPGAVLSYATGVSGSNVIGGYAGSDGVAQGFLYDGLHYSTLDPPGATSVMPAAVSGNNVVGGYFDINGVGHAFLYNGLGYTTLDPPGATSANAVAVSGNNVVGMYYTTSSLLYYLYNGSSYTTISVPGLRDITFAHGVSGSNVVGYFIDYNTGAVHGFLYNGSSYTTLDAPGASSTWATGISGASIVGYFLDDYGMHGFLYDGSSYTTLDAPGSTYTIADGVSGSKVVGYFNDSNGSTHGFLYQPSGTVPEPSSLILLSIGFLAVAAGYRIGELRK